MSEFASKATGRLVIGFVGFATGFVLAAILTTSANHRDREGLNEALDRAAAETMGFCRASIKVSEDTMNYCAAHGLSTNQGKKL